MIHRATALKTCLALAREAAERILDVKRLGALNIVDKGHDDPVTAADHASNAVITKGLSAAFPDAVIVSEENDPSTFARYREADACFFVDPLDGTKPFVRGSDDFCVMIGLVEGGVPVLGVIVCPATRDAAYAVRGLGAFAEMGDGTTRALRIDGSRRLGDATLLVSSTHQDDHVRARLANIGARELVPRGSVGVKAIEVCLGRADGYVHPTPVAGKRWDVAAAEVIVVEAGGRLCESSGNAFDYRAASLDNAGILCGAPGLVAEIAARLRGEPAP